MVPFEHFEHFGEVEQAAAKSIDFIDDHTVDPAGFDVGHQAFERWPIHVAAGETAVVVAVRQALPSLVLLRCDVGLARVALGV